MGEAKRRKQLGMMPTAEDREVIFERGGEVTGDPLPPVVLERLKAWAETGLRWDARYRTTFVGAGLPRDFLKTEDDLRAIPVPERMRLRLGLLSGSAAWLAQEREHDPDSLFEEDVPGGQPQTGQLQTRQLRVRATDYLFDGRWAELPQTDTDGMLTYLMQHPAVMAEPGGTDYVVTVQQSGEVSVEPGPDEEHRAALTQAARELLGNSGEDDENEWAELHQDSLGEELSEENEPAPLARRTVLRLSPAALVLSPTARTLAQSGEMDINAVQHQGSYTHDGETWHDYPEVLDRRAELQALMAQMGLNDMGGLEALLGEEAGTTGHGDVMTIDMETADEVGADGTDTDGADAAEPQPGGDRQA